MTGWHLSSNVVSLLFSWLSPPEIPFGHHGISCLLAPLSCFIFKYSIMCFKSWVYCYLQIELLLYLLLNPSTENFWYLYIYYQNFNFVIYQLSVGIKIELAGYVLKNLISFTLYCAHKFWYCLNMASLKRNYTFRVFFSNIPNEKYTIWAILFGIFISIIWQL